MSAVFSPDNKNSDDQKLTLMKRTSDGIEREAAVAISKNMTVESPIIFS